MQYHEVYFYTATIKDWKPLIAKYDLQDTILNSWAFLCMKQFISVYGFVIMPNHIHVVWEMLKPNGKEIPSASFMKFTAHAFEKHIGNTNIADLKNYSTNADDRKYNFWQSYPDAFLLTNPKTIIQKLDYMHNNPLQPHWQLALDPIDYPYSSARFYNTGEKNFGFLSDYRDWAG